MLVADQSRVKNKMLDRVRHLDRIHHTCPREVDEASALILSKVAQQQLTRPNLRASSLRADSSPMLDCFPQ